MWVDLAGLIEEFPSEAKAYDLRYEEQLGKKRVSFWIIAMAGFSQTKCPFNEKFMDFLLFQYKWRFILEKSRNAFQQAMCPWCCVGMQLEQMEMSNWDRKKRHAR